MNIESLFEVFERKLRVNQYRWFAASLVSIA
jgi:hypothetical protein